MAQGDAAAAAVKFQAVTERTPSWGRSHLKWGEALARLGKTEDARAQFKAALRLRLSAPDRVELSAQHV